MNRLVWSLVMFLAVAVGLYASAALFAPPLRTPFVQNLFATTPIAIIAHLGGGVIAIVLGAFQINSKLRARYLSTHRWLGRVYVIAVMIGGIAGLALAVKSTGGLVTHFGFGMMAVLWLGTTTTAYVQIRSGNVAAHRAWMLRSYALTLAAVTLRIYLTLSQVAGIEFSAAYPAISWLCWVPNLLFVEWFLLARRPIQAKAA